MCRFIITQRKPAVAFLRQHSMLLNCWQLHLCQQLKGKVLLCFHGKMVILRPLHVTLYVQSLVSCLRTEQDSSWDHQNIFEFSNLWSAFRASCYAYDNAGRPNAVMHYCLLREFIKTWLVHISVTGEKYWRHFYSSNNLKVIYL